MTFALNGRVVTLTWQASAGAFDYVVEAGTTPGASNVVNVNVGPQRSVTSPAPPGRYFVRVRARNTVGMSGPSNEVVIDVP